MAPIHRAENTGKGGWAVVGMGRKPLDSQSPYKQQNSVLPLGPSALSFSFFTSECMAFC